ncbi:MAG: hypothetical protein IH845_03935 [Nanoarchaeota archaeon]|nr:hypothetical protein [Nanoarchaeota archaeon]
MEERFDNLTDEEVYGAIVEETPISKRRKKITLIFIAVLLIGILLIGYEIAPNYSLDKGQYLLRWLRP